MYGPFKLEKPLDWKERAIKVEHVMISYAPWINETAVFAANSAGETLSNTDIIAWPGRKTPNTALEALEYAREYIEGDNHES